MNAFGKTNQLSKERKVRPMEGIFNQRQMFTLRKFGLYSPATEKIVNLREWFDISNNSSIPAAPNGANNLWRSGLYVFYPKGFESGKMAMGDRLVYVDGGIARILNLPDVEVKFNWGRTVGLRAATGIGIIKLEKLELKQIGEKADEVSVTTDFDPKTDLTIVNVSSGWALPDANGIPLKSRPARKSNPDARHCLISMAPAGESEGDFEEGSTGYHGSLIVGSGFGIVGGRVIDASGHFVGWSDSTAVLLISRPDAEIAQSDPSGLKISETDGKIIIEGTPEKLAEARRLLNALKC